MENQTLFPIGDGRPQPVNAKALTVAEAARLLQVPAELIQADIEEGAPVGPDGTIHLVQYAAWLNAKDAHGD
jgi:hypothetical protein